MNEKRKGVQNFLGTGWTTTGSSIYVHSQVTRMKGKVQEFTLKTPNAYRSIIVAEDVLY